LFRSVRNLLTFLPTTSHFHVPLQRVFDRNSAITCLAREKSTIFLHVYTFGGDFNYHSEVFDNIERDTNYGTTHIFHIMGNQWLIWYPVVTCITISMLGTRQKMWKEMNFFLNQIARRFEDVWNLYSPSWTITLFNKLIYRQSFLCTIS